ncbi:MAG: hypothetical protein DRI88_07695 [Bacteroidetes bacterium]|nr:MAG: hypothetical protein DRI72_06860 [Bacteroidota bacterium]RLD46332.1 MAG: hypothetical protein DRI88_07695 [Bacteroidota bacterium]RLD70307.1 MAG: hypothetical protein DRI87_08535 [Bacteroidota bacterium]RLD84273.1 MAG: hypothetical protein DRJ02_11960 [Bacteroidota bacterium]
MAIKENLNGRIMKRILLFTITTCFVFASFAQKTSLTPQPGLKNMVATQSNFITGEATYPASEPNPYVLNDRDQDIVVGETWYDLQSNSTMPRRIYTYEDGTMGAVWTQSLVSNWSDRGTGYNYYDSQNWGPVPTERIESVRTGWPSYAPYGENGEIICAHDYAAGELIFSWRETKGEGEWNHFTLNGPDGYDFMAWARVSTSGENRDIIHVIANLPVTQNGGDPYEGLSGAIVYSRSFDGGLTWDPENALLDGMGSDYAKAWGADDYAWAEPNAGVIAFVAFGGIADGIVMKSDDDGDNWERVTFYESPDPFFDGNGGDLPKCGGGDGYNAISIDDDGIVHVAFGRQIHIDDTPDDDAWSYYPYSDGLVYWNETMPPLDTAQIRSDIIPDDWSTLPIYQNGQLAAWTLPNGEDTIIGVAPYYASLTSMPQIVISNDVIRIFYSALTLGFATEDYNYRHIWVSSKEGNSDWGEFTDLNNDIFHIISECVYPSASPKLLNNSYPILYQTDQLPGNSLQPDPPTHAPVLNKMVFLPAFVPIVGTEETSAAIFDVSQNYPNPTNEQTYVAVTLNEGADLSLQVFSITGQIVHTKNYGYKTAGTHNLKMNVSDLTPGVYFYSVYTGTQKVTRKMIVQ